MPHVHWNSDMFEVLTTHQIGLKKFYLICVDVFPRYEIKVFHSQEFFYYIQGGQELAKNQQFVNNKFAI